jgi:hypothetical protein
VTKYIALSYTWGGAVPRAIRTFRENLDKRITAKFDLPAHPDCPATYRDAIEVAHHLLVDYIWIDSICMVQDDEADRKLHFTHFDKGVGQIYEDAYLTLCSIGLSADHKLLESREVTSGSVRIPFGDTPIIVTPRVRWLKGHLSSGGVLVDGPTKNGFLALALPISRPARQSSSVSQSLKNAVSSRCRQVGTMRVISCEPRTISSSCSNFGTTLLNTIRNEN